MIALVLVEHDNGEVKDATLSAVTAAAKLGDDIESIDESDFQRGCVVA